MKEKAKIVIAIAIVAAVLAGAGAAFVFAGDYIINQFMLITKDEQGYFKWISLKQVSTVGERIKSDRAMNENETVYGGEELNISFSASEEFCDTLNVYSFKEIGLKTAVSHSKDEVSVLLAPKYDGKNLFTVKFLTYTDTGELYAQVPDYSLSAIDLSALYDTEAGSRLLDKLRMLEPGISNETPEAAADGNSDEKISTAELEELTRYYTYLVNSFENISIEKRKETEINGQKIRYNNVRVEVTAEELKAQLTGLTNLLEEYGRISRQDADKYITLITKIDSSVRGSLDMYIDGRGRTIGGKISMSVKETEVSAEINKLINDEQDGIECRAFVNSLPALDISFSSAKPENGHTSFDITVEPGSFLKSFLKNFAQYKLAVSFDKDKGKSEISLELNNGAKKLADLTLNSSSSGYNGPLLNLDNQRVYDYSTLTASSYLNISELVGWLLGIREKIGENYIDDYLNGLLERFLGDGMTVDVIAAMYESGYFSFLSVPDNRQDYRIYSGKGRDYGTSGTNLGMTPTPVPSPTATPTPSPSPTPTPTPTPTPEPKVPGIVSVAPDEYVPRSFTYPDSDGKYYYSYDYLKSYCNPGKCEGLSYAVPLSGEISHRQYEEAQSNFLKKYEGMFTYDQSTITVQNGDDIYMDIVPLLAGQPFTMYSYTDCYELVGSDQYGEGLDNSLLGMHVGETRDIEATLGETYGDFAGYTGMFRVTLTKIVRPVVPEWTTDFICGWLQFASLDECKDALMQQLMSKVEFSEDTVAEVLADMLFDKAMFGNVSDKDMNVLRQEVYDRLYAQSIEFGMKPEKYYMTRLGYSFEEFLAMLNHEASDNLRRKCFYAAICDDKKLYLKGDEVTVLIDAAMAEYGAADFDELMNIVTLDEIINAELEKRAARYLYDNAVLTYK